jgi:3-keto-5-aminohexanoate cleavage enzyme
MIWRPYGLPEIMNLETSAFHDGEISQPWDIPEKMIVSVAITGAFFQHKQNPSQPITPDEIRESAREVALAGASVLHIHVRDDNGYNVLSPRRFHDVIAPLHKEFPAMPIDGCLVPALAGEWDKMTAVMESKLLDAAPINATATCIGDALFAKPAPVIMEKTRLINSNGAKPEIAVYTDADVAIAKRYLISSGLVETPAFWLVLPAPPGGSPMDNHRQMIEGPTRIVSSIRDVDPAGLTMVCAAGRVHLPRHPGGPDGPAHPGGDGGHLLQVAAPHRPDHLQPRGAAASPEDRRGHRPRHRYARASAGTDGPAAHPRVQRRQQHPTGLG